MTTVPGRMAPTLNSVLDNAGCGTILGASARVQALQFRVKIEINVPEDAIEFD